MGKLLERRRVPPPPAVPPLRDGDMMNTTEFLRRYEAMPDGFRAELLGGVVHINRSVTDGPQGEEGMAPIAAGGHGRPQFRFMYLAGRYEHRTPGVSVYCPSTLVLSETDTVPEPDGILAINTDCGGDTQVGGDDYLYGVPEFILEVSNTTASHDLGFKRRMYHRNEVPEYFVWRTAIDEIHFFQWESKAYVEIVPGRDGILRSKMFPGLWIDPQALIVGDLDRLMEVVELGTASPEHAKFVEKLRKAKAKKK